MSSAEITYPFATLCAKLSILLLYLNLFNVSRRLRVTVYIGVVVLTLFYTAMMAIGIATMVKCAGLESEIIDLCSNMVDEVQLLNSAFNVVTDCWIFILPMPHILKLQMPLRRKLGLAAVFSIALA